MGTCCCKSSIAKAVRQRIQGFFADERVRFLLVGGFNTAFGYLVFVAIDLTLGRALRLDGNPVWASIASLALSHIVATIPAFILYRRFVFKVRGNVLLDMVRFQAVYVVPLSINFVVLPFLVWLGWPAILAQAAIVIVNVVINYFGHKHISFRRRKVD